MKVGIVGTGYVGLPTGAALAELGNDVICVDKESKKIEALRAGSMPLYEEGLEELFLRNHRNGRLKFTTSMKEGVAEADIVLVTVGTPLHPVTRVADMEDLYAAVSELAEYLTGYTVIAVKSTVPVGTGDELETLIRADKPSVDMDVVSLPEFLREGLAVHDFFNPERIICGTNSERAKVVINKLYSAFRNKTKILFVSRRSSECIKYASNAFLAVKIHYVNEMANFCEKIGADITEVTAGMGLDSRIGPRFLCAGPGYGGSCFPKDTIEMVHMARMNHVRLTLVESVIEGNAERITQMAERILNVAKNIENPRIAVWGLAFKAGTDDCRESPSIAIIEELLLHKMNIIAYDPKAMRAARLLFGERISYAQDKYNAAKSADILAVLTEWLDFKHVDLEKLGKIMKNKNIVDCRNLLNEKEVIEAGFKYQRIGKQV